MLFDLDGPILDVSEKYYRVYSDLVEHRGYAALPKAEFWDLKRARVRDEVILQRSGIEGWEQEFRELRHGLIETDQYLAFDRVWPGAVEVLKRISEYCPPILVTLRHSREALERQLAAFDLLGQFQTVLSAGATSGGENAQTKVDLVRRYLGSDELAGWFVGDTETDCRAGRLLGIRTVAVTYGIRTHDQLLDRLKDLGPCPVDLIIDEPSKLADWAVHVFGATL